MRRAGGSMRTERSSRKRKSDAAEKEDIDFAVFSKAKPSRERKPEPRKSSSKTSANTQNAAKKKQQRNKKLKMAKMNQRAPTDPISPTSGENDEIAGIPGDNAEKRKDTKKQNKADISDIFSSGKAEARKKMASLANEKKCPKGHRVNPTRTPYAGYYCDLCQSKGLPKGTWMFGCRTCDWDACRKCIEPFDHKKAAAAAAENAAAEAMVSATKKRKERYADLTADERKWIDDGLGGVYDQEGWTGRQTGEGMRIFKALHSRNKNGGDTPLCPIDCDCCF